MSPLLSAAQTNPRLISRPTAIPRSSVHLGQSPPTCVITSDMSPGSKRRTQRLPPVQIRPSESMAIP
jgi:hypothetical protein